MIELIPVAYFFVSRESNLFTSVYLSAGARVSKRVGYIPACNWDDYPRKDYPLEGLPPERTTPREGLPPLESLPLEPQIAGGTHPTGMLSCCSSFHTVMNYCNFKSKIVSVSVLCFFLVELQKCSCISL